MAFWVAVIVIFIIAFLWALFNLSSELAKPRELKKIKEKLHKEKILFKRN